MRDYTAFDAAILQRVRHGRTEFISIFAGDVRLLSEEIAGPKGDAFRVVDRRLQALRKAGKLVYTRRTGWQISLAAGTDGGTGNG